MAICKYCEEEIIWAEVGSGSNLPFDAVPIKDVSAAVRAPYTVINGKARKRTSEDEKLHRDAYACHFDTCKK